VGDAVAFDRPSTAALSRPALSKRRTAGPPVTPLVGHRRRDADPTSASAGPVCLSASWEPETLEPSELKDIAVLRTMLYAKLRRVSVRQADLNDVGSARIDPACFRSPGSTWLGGGRR